MRLAKRLHKIAHIVLPNGLLLLGQYASRFRGLQWSPYSAWTAAAQSGKRKVLVQSRIEILPEFLRRGRIGRVIDAGANEGQWLASLLEVSKVDRAWVFEPNPETFSRLSARFGPLLGMSMHNEALGEKEGELDFNITRDSVFSSMLPPDGDLVRMYGQGAEVVKSQRVKVVTLDDVIPKDEHIDLLKIDVQGFEESVLRGASATLSRTSVLLMECNFRNHYTGDGDFASLATLLSEYGFDFWNMAELVRGKDNRVRWADASFLSRAVSKRLQQPEASEAAKLRSATAAAAGV